MWIPAIHVFRNLVNKVLITPLFGQIVSQNGLHNVVAFNEVTIVTYLFFNVTLEEAAKHVGFFGKLKN